MRRLWWPEPLYEIKPFGALTLGLLAGAAATVRSVATGGWDVSIALIAAAGLGVMAYGVAVLVMRFRYRRHSRWHRERRG